MDEAVGAAMRLHTSGISPRRQTALVKGLGSAQAVFAAPEEALLQSCPRMTQADLRALTEATRADVGPTVARLGELGVSLLCFGTEEYPRLLTEIDDPPAVLYHVEMKLINLGWRDLLLQQAMCLLYRNLGVNQT